MTLDEMRAFVKVAELGSFTKAATSLNSHTSRVSELVRDLETTLKAQLIVRSTRSMRLTEIGKEVLSKAKAILASVDDLIVASRQVNDKIEGHLRITAAGDYGLLKGFSEAFPKVSLSIHHEKVNVDLVRDDFDLALRLGPLQNSGLRSQRLGDLSFGLFASPEYLDRNGTPHTPDDLDQFSWLRLNLKPQKAISFTWQKRLIEINNNPRFTFTDVAGLRDGAIQGLGIARLSIPVAAPWLEFGRLSVVLPAATFETTPLYAVYSSRGQTSHLIKAFIDYARNVFSKGIAINHSLQDQADGEYAR